MQVVFRTDASIAMGTGHVMRCLTLADMLRERGAHCRFVSRAHPGHLARYIRERGHGLELLSSAGDTAAAKDELLPQHAAWLGATWQADADQTLAALGSTMADWLIVDHYALDARWERATRHACRNLMAIDDLADRPHECSVLLDQNLDRKADDYAPRVPSGCRLLTGPRYALLRPEFAAHRRHCLDRRGARVLRHLLIAMGGMDAENVTTTVLDALTATALPADCRISVVMGAQAPWLDTVRARASAMQRPTEVLIGVRNMAQLMCDSDLAIGATGGTAWERCCLGLPTVAIVLAVNQRGAAMALERSGAVLRCELGAGFQGELRQIVATACRPEVLRRLALAASMITDGMGAARVADVLYDGSEP